MKNKNLKDPLFSWGRSLYAIIGYHWIWFGSVVQNGFMITPKEFWILRKCAFNFLQIKAMFSFNQVLNMLTQEAQFQFVIVRFIQAIFPQNPMFLRNVMANFTVYPGRRVSIFYRLSRCTLVYSWQKQILSWSSALVKASRKCNFQRGLWQETANILKIPAFEIVSVARTDLDSFNFKGCRSVLIANNKPPRRRPSLPLR